jgi:hypothetical protein
MHRKIINKGFVIQNMENITLQQIDVMALSNLQWSFLIACCPSAVM